MLTLIIMPFKVLRQGNKWKKKKSSLYALTKLNDQICIGLPEMANNDWENGECSHIVLHLTLKVPIKTAADDKFFDIFSIFEKK